MILIKQRHQHTAPNAWGRDATSEREHWRIEEQDIGKTLSSFGGLHCRTLLITAGDVGKTLERCYAKDYFAQWWVTS